MEPGPAPRKYFVTIHTPSDEALQKLSTLGLDVFRASAIRTAIGMRSVETTGGDTRAASPAPGVEALLTIAEIERLVGDGYRVTLEEEASQRARATGNAVEFDEWLKGVEA